MEEQLEDQSQEGFHLSEYIDLVRRRRWLLLIPLFSVWLLVWVATWFLPSVYRSGTLDFGGTTCGPGETGPNQRHGRSRRAAWTALRSKF